MNKKAPSCRISDTECIIRTFPQQAAVAQRQLAASASRIETATARGTASQKPSTYRVGKSTSDYGR